MKAKSIVSITFEMMAYILGLPEEVSIENIIVDHDRDIVKFKLSSQEPYDGMTYQVAEGCQIPATTIKYGDGE